MMIKFVGVMSKILFPIRKVMGRINGTTVGLTLYTVLEAYNIPVSDSSALLS
jgi:hypothetical protein